MKQIDSSELKKIQICLLDSFDGFCRRNGIHYWLDYGTLLGAVRHKGFIPWDDDVDISMLREDYEKAASLYNVQSDGRFVFQTQSNTKDSCYPFGKLIDSNTVLYEYGETGIETGVYIDVFVYDNAPDDKEKSDRVFRKRDLLGRIRRLQLPMRKGMTGKKKMAYKIGSTIMHLFPRGLINRALDKNARRYEHVSTKFVSPFVDPYDPTYFKVEKTVFQDLVEIEFEGKLYFAPRNYDYWLGILYGNYMELPPVENRVNHHIFEAFYKES
ncbi:MAG: LicD family protein [Firmicutes bacterium]|nr:LicD family protein [Bacillota bacterium]